MARRNRSRLKRASQLRAIRHTMDRLEATSDQIIRSNQNATPVTIQGSRPDWFRWIEIVGIFVALGALVFTIWSVDLTRKGLEQTRSALKHESVARAWQILTTPASGNSGKVQALETLYSNNISLIGVDLSCEKMGGGWNKETYNCKRPTELMGLNLPGIKNELFDAMLPADRSNLMWEERAVFTKANFDGAHMFSVKLSGADLWRASLNGVDARFSNFHIANLREANLHSSLLSQTDFSFANLLRANLTKADLRNSSLSGANLFETNLTGANVKGAIFKGTHISGVKLCSEEFDCIHNLTFEQITSAWAFSDEWNPHILPKYLRIGDEHTWPKPRLCPINLKLAGGVFYHKDPISGLPIGC